MQVYSDLHILSARPSGAEMGEVPHRLYGHVPARIEYSAGDWARASAELIATARQSAQRLIFAGGTGLCFKALTDGLVEVPPIPTGIRTRWENESRRGADLFAILQSRDPAAASGIRPGDHARLIRALEVFDGTGQSITVWRRETTKPLLEPGSWRGVFLNPERAALYASIDQRFTAMLAAGAREEVQTLMALNLPANRGIMKAHGVPHLAACIRGEVTLETAIELSQRDTRNYAKRQVIWARKFMRDWTWAGSSEAAISALNFQKAGQIVANTPHPS